MFVDLAKIKIKAGKGGDGVVAWRREIYIEKGGPSGGDGGKGGDIVFVGNNQINTLQNFRYNQIIRAEDGQNGAKQKKHGKSGEDKVISVPVGTIIKINGETVEDITSNGQKAVVAKGGLGGFGNAHFISSTRQAPRVAELGEKGEEFELELELKLLADVGLVGLPNAGKSTFLSVATNAKPQIADYPFTTLEPNLGVHYIGDDTLLIADIPGIIEGASHGKGLGFEFLRHIERTAVLLHLVDANSNNPLADYRTINEELVTYGLDLSDRKVFVILSKTDGIEDELIEDLRKDFIKEIKEEVYVISSVKDIGINELMRDVLSEVKVFREKEDLNTDEDELPVITIDMEEAWEVEKVKKGHYRVTGKKIEKFAQRTNFDNDWGVQRLKDIMRKMGIIHALYRKGAGSDDVVEIGEDHFVL